MSGKKIESSVELGAVGSSTSLDYHYDADGPSKKESRIQGFFRRKGKTASPTEPVEPVAEDEEAVAGGGVGSLFIYADVKDYVLITIGTVASALAGAVFPLFGTVMGDLMDAFYPKYQEEKVVATALNFFYLALLLLVTSYLSFALFGISAARQVRQIRSNALHATLHQEMGWFDVSSPNEISSRIAGDTVIVEKGMGDKLGSMVRDICQFFSGFIIGFVKGWKLTLAMLACMPVLALTFGGFGIFMSKFLQQTQTNYAKAGGIAEQTFGSMRTVAALRAEDTLFAKFQGYVRQAEKACVSVYGSMCEPFTSGCFLCWSHFQELSALSGAVLLAISLGSAFGTIFLTYALGWWMGGYLMSHGDDQVQTVGDVTNVFFSVMMGSMALSQAGPNIKAFMDAVAAMRNIIKIIKREPKIGADMDAGVEKSKLTGNIAFRNVHFAYPARPEATILSNFNLEVKAGQTVALVGQSGSGKSTCIQLLERFYDPLSGSVEVDGLDVRNLKLRWLRSQMALVSQEPILFSGTIAENIAWGAGDMSTVTMDEIILAAKRANAHKFIMQFPDGYETFCGEKGAQLSGGQKQRVAIARAIIRSPNILLLDEATSALDTESERIVQEALDQLMEDKNRTCLVVAHRLSTIRNADLIVVFDKGQAVEQGTHNDLVAKDGVYAQLVKIQMGAAESEDSEKIAKDHEYEEKILQTLRSRQSAKSSSTRRSKVSRQDSHHSDHRRDSVVSASQLYPRPSMAAVDQAAEYLEENAPELLGDVETGDAEEMEGWQLQKRIYAATRPQLPFQISGLLLAILCGCVFPLMSLILTDMMKTLGLLAYDVDKLYDEICKYALYFVGFAVVSTIIQAGMMISYDMVGEKLTTTLRERTFKATVRQDIGYFDMEENSTGAITARLATDATLVKSVAGQNQGRMVQNFATLGCALVIAFALGSWKVTLVNLALLPPLVFVSILQMRAMGMGAQESQESVAESGKLATEAVMNSRTVKAFGLEDNVRGRYYKALTVSTREGIKKAHIGGLATGLTFFIMFGGYALVFWYGGTLVGKGEVTFDECLKSFFAIMMAAMGMGQTAAFAGDAKAANAAAAKIFAVEDRHPPIASESPVGVKDGVAKGDIEVRNIVFKYPSRPNQIILNDYNLKIEAGQTVALVGESGSGKSTMVSLVMRFYDPVSGEVLLDGKNVSTLNVGWLRDQIGIVQQEPVLFSGSISDNIRMGKPGATQAEIEEAAKMSNAHSFIVNFPAGYNTEVGDGGVQLSGGQKQRIAIARAIIKNPAILLLGMLTINVAKHDHDEATSALDAESERVVQEALDSLLAMKRRTTLIVAHRLSTIMNADKIAVHQGGKVVELGTYNELLQLDGVFAKLVKNQVRT